MVHIAKEIDKSLIFIYNSKIGPRHNWIRQKGVSHERRIDDHHLYGLSVLLAWLIKSVVRLDDEKTASPVLPCILMGIDLLILLSAFRWYF